MADDLALRAYRNELERLRSNALRAVGDVRRHLDAVDSWLADAPGSFPQTRNLGTDVATLTEYVAALKALQDVAYLTEEN